MQVCINIFYVDKNVRILIVFVALFARRCLLLDPKHKSSCVQLHFSNKVQNEDYTPLVFNCPVLTFYYIFLLVT